MHLYHHARQFSRHPLTVPVDLTVYAAPTVSVNPSTILMNYQNCDHRLSVANPGSDKQRHVGIVLQPVCAIHRQRLHGDPLVHFEQDQRNAYAPGQYRSGNGCLQPGVSLPAGTYHGEVTVTADNASQTIPVQLLVSNTPLLNVAPSTVTFTSELNGSAPAPVTVEATATSGQPAITVVPTTTSGGNWLFAQVGASHQLRHAHHHQRERLRPDARTIQRHGFGLAAAPRPVLRKPSASPSTSPTTR